jgi:PKD repeat protein
MKKELIYAFIIGMMAFSQSCTKKTTETDPPLTVPVASFIYSGTLVVGSPITFTNKSTDATSYLWDFGDPASGANNTSTTENPQHIYNAMGDYTVKLTATGTGGTNSISKNIKTNFGGCVKEIVIVGASINTATTWDSCHIYYVKTTFPGLFATLTIEAGTIVKFGAQHGMLVNTGGRLVVNGTAAAPVIFTSSKDDSYGGDTNGDSTATVPAKGDWQFITFGLSSDNSLNYCKIMYAGYASETYEQALNMGDGANNSIRNSVFAHNAGGTDSKFAALNMSWCPISSVAQGNTFFDNGHPVIIGTSTNFDDSNIFHNPANPAETNLCNGIFVDCVHTQDQAPAMTWSETEVAFVFGGWSGNLWVMDAGKVLVLGDNVVLKFARYTTPGFSILMPDGEVQLQNYDGTGVAFTAYTDDSRKGDTNGDGPSVGTAGYWEGIFTAGPSWYNWGNIYFASPH